MELMLVARQLWRRKWLLLAGFIVAIAAAFAKGGDAPTSSGLAWTHVILDTPKSQIVDSAPDAASSLPWRATLMTHLMTSDDVRATLASRLQVEPDQVRVIDPTQALARVPASVPAAAAESAAINGSPYVLTAYLQNESLPMITLEAAAPDLDGAKRLIAAGVAYLGTQASEKGTYTSPILTGAGKNELEPFTVQQTAPARAQLVVSDKGPVTAIGVAVFIFLFWTSAVLVVPPLVGLLRGTARVRPA
jgi:hypothetical protein